MSSASQNFPHHLDVLRERMLDPTDYELAVNYFLEEFAGDVAFLRGSEPEQMPQLVAVLNIVVSKATRRQVEVENALVSYLRKHRFVHGNAQVDGRIVLFFYFEEADTAAAHADSRNSRPRWRLCGSTQKAACPTHAAIACTQPQRLSRAIRQVRINRVCRTALNACITFEPAQLSQEVSIRIASFS